MAKVTVLGAGAWGVALGILLAENGEWTFDKTIKIKGLEYNIVAEVKDDVIDYIQDPTMTLFSKILIVADSFETAKMITEDTTNFSSASLIQP